MLKLTVVSTTTSDNLTKLFVTATPSNFFFLFFGGGQILIVCFNAQSTPLSGKRLTCDKETGKVAVRHQMECKSENADKIYLISL